MPGGAWRQGALCALAPDPCPEPQWGDRASSVSTPSRNLCFTVTAGFLPYTGLVWALVMLCFFSTLFLNPFLFYVLASPGSRGGQGRCGGPAAFLLGAVGFVLSLLCGWLLLRCSNGLEKPIWGREARTSLLPLLFWCFFCCHFRSHSRSENIVADTQQDDLLAVIHGESSQTGFFPLMINLYIKFETQQKLPQIILLDALTHGYRTRKKCIYSFNKYLSIPTV